MTKFNCPIVFISDQSFAMPLATALRSIVETNQKSWPLDFHVLTDGFSGKLRKKVFDSIPQGSASIRWIVVDLKPFEKFHVLPHIPAITYARFLIPDVFPKTVERVLYLDADILVLNDLSPLLEIDLDGAVLGAALDSWNDPRIKSGLPVPEGTPVVRDYLEAGVLLIDLGRWREEQISEKAMVYLNQHPTTPYQDQDALNVACDTMWMKLDRRWNCQDHRKYNYLDIDPEHWPYIIQFVTDQKPWIEDSSSLNVSLFEDFRSRTFFRSES